MRLGYRAGTGAERHRHLAPLRVEPGYLADVIVVEGNPLEDIRVMADPQRPPRLVLKDGAILVDRLSEH